MTTKMLWDYFEGKSTPPQQQMLLEWLREPVNQEQFFEILHQWEKANPQVLGDLEKDWDHVLTKLDSIPEINTFSYTENSLLPDRRNPLKYWLAAASVVAIVLTGLWKREVLLNKTYQTAFGEVKSLVLEDGSRVTLNANSILTTSRLSWFQAKREVKLIGEAEFSVVHTKDHRPFLVKTSDGVEVKVLGTEFVVYSRKEVSRVALATGKIQIRSLKTLVPPMNVQPGEVVTVNRQGKMHLNKEENIKDHLAWKEHLFVFNKSSLAEIAGQIQERFGVQIEIPDTSLASTRLSGYYPAEDADRLISMLTILLNLQSQKLSDNKVLITRQ